MAEIRDFGPRKTIFILAIVAGCFAVLWPKIFYPMLTASVTTTHQPSDNSACCGVFFESDVTAADIMYEMCQNILKHHRIDPRVRDALRTVKLTPQSASLCREEIIARCGIDLSTFLAERESLGKSYKQVLEEVRSFNSSLCLKIHFGIPLSQLGTPHLIRYHILMPHSTIKQERRTPPHAGGLHPALIERGRAIPSSHIVPKVTDRPDHVVPKMRPPLGGAGHVVPAPKGNGTMGIIMPLYTLGIVLFFLYTIVKVLKKNSDSEIIAEYPGAAAEKEFRKMVFSPEAFTTAMTGGSVPRQKERSPSPQKPAPTIQELKDLDGPPKSKGLAGVDRSPKDDTAADGEHSKADEEVANIEQSPTVKVMGMEMTASCEGKGSRPTTPIIPITPSHVEREKTPPKPIYLEGALPPQCELLVTDSETQAQKVEEDVEAPVVLSGKMTLSLISLDQNAAESEEEEDREIRYTEDATQILNTEDEEETLNIETIAGRKYEVHGETESKHKIEDEQNEISEETGQEAKELRVGLEEERTESDAEDDQRDEAKKIKVNYDEEREEDEEKQEEIEETEEEEEEVEEIEEEEVDEEEEIELTEEEEEEVEEETEADDESEEENQSDVEDEEEGEEDEVEEDSEELEQHDERSEEENEDKSEVDEEVEPEEEIEESEEEEDDNRRNI
ncbi:PREDICTED: ABC transporter F family member 4-like isoform X2 [Habropoda laboriosa]|uniref:ABC transporter F family member 4-like isoform X2 n=1 Tax=Habropoda laboriosa TaxID=597456 RepID=UPI00083DEA06|nr:PREDICTED: ABC transporter F family member 4-like isoform X2 [Habropoda laboriosa]